MPTMDIFTETTQRKILDELKLQNSLVAIIARGYNIESFAAVQEIVRSGQAARIFSIGDQFVSPWVDTAANVTYQVPWDLKHFGTVLDEDGDEHPAIFLQWHWATPFGVQFDAPEQTVATEATFTEGYYYYTKNDDGSFTQQTVTYGAAIPSGTTYYKSIFNNAASTLRYGYNRWAHSAMRQWLNSDEEKGNWWTAQHEGDIAPDQHSTKDGFVRGLASDLLDVVNPIKIVTAKNTVTDDGALETTYDRFFLPSVEQMYGSPQISGEGEYWDYWKEATGLSSPSNAENTGRIHYGIEAQTSAQNVRLRSAARGYSGNAWSAAATGQLSSSGVHIAYRCAPACAIY